MADPTTPQAALDAATAALDAHAAETERAAELAAIKHPSAGEKGGTA